MKKKSFSALMSLLLCVCMLASMVVVPAAAAEKEPADMDGHWAQEAAERWTKAGIMELDENGNFNPTDKLTRAKFAVLLCKLMGYSKKADASTFVDLPEDKEAADALLMLSEAGVMMGVGDGRAAPDSMLTREHVAVMVFRALKLKPNTDSSLAFADSEQVSDWAKAEMATMASLKMMEGVGNNTLAPKNNIPNQDMASLLDKMIADYVTEDGATVDTSKAANPNGVVIIKANNVKIADAAKSTGIVVTEDAPKNATVTVTGAASKITVAAEGAKLSVGKKATVESVAVEAPKAAVEVSGKVGDVAVAKEAESAKVTVAKGAEVSSVAVEAPKTAVEVSGKVGDVAVAAGADKTTVTAKSGAKVENVTTSAEDVKVNGAKNAIQNVTADAGSAEIKANGATVKNDGADNVKVDGKPVASGSTTNSTQTGTNTTPSVGGGGGGGNYNPEPSTSPDPGPSESPDPGPSESPDPGPSESPDPGPSESPDPQPTEYDITVKKTGNGTVTVKLDGKEVAKAAKDAKITVTATPEQGNELDGKITVTDADGNNVEVSENGIFTMPENNVTVTVTFKSNSSPVDPTPENETYVIAKSVTGISITIDGKEVEKVAVEKGKEVKVEVKATDGYTVTSVTIADKAQELAADGIYTFTMPENDVTVSATAAKNYALKIWTIPNGSGENAEDASITSIKVGGREMSAIPQTSVGTVNPWAGSDVEITVSCKKDIAVALAYDGAGKNTADKPTVSKASGDATNGFTWTITFKMPEKDAELTIGVKSTSDGSSMGGLNACFGGNNTNTGASLTESFGEKWTTTTVPGEDQPVKSEGGKVVNNGTTSNTQGGDSGISPSGITPAE